ncbi:response regulator transcription factor [Fibrella sp. HMF5335]|uniref:Response regulator transcription factor n=1 Tax=Fibrella rubiginis TaxID=2817060 RepID=A0A939K6L5_9BACT|nr:response regulator transcription factor [Fibrella rubiginis]MBO0938963.1 response regulator transcription factor [Fibrella rubiginis]
MPPEPVSRILLIDDHRVFNDALKSLLNEQPDLTVCGQVSKASEAIHAVQRTSPHLILLDINLQGVNGIDLGRAILSDFPLVRILMLTMYNQPKLLDEARRVGLQGYLLKDASTNDLLRAIRNVLNGGTSFDANVPNLTSPPEDPFGDQFASRLHLTFREVEIIALIREGLSNEQIADKIHLSPETVKTHRKNIHFKLGISKVTELVQFAIKNGI